VILVQRVQSVDRRHVVLYYHTCHDVFLLDRASCPFPYYFWGNSVPPSVDNPATPIRRLACAMTAIQRIRFRILSLHLLYRIFEKKLNTFFKKIFKFLRAYVVLFHPFVMYRGERR
jgi:hypothetical protein